MLYLSAFSLAGFPLCLEIFFPFHLPCFLIAFSFCSHFISFDQPIEKCFLVSLSPYPAVVFVCVAIVEFCL